MLKASLAALAGRLRKWLHIREGPERDVRILYVWSATRKLSSRNLPHVHHRVLKVDF